MTHLSGAVLAQGAAGRRSTRICFVGWGAIARRVAQLLDANPDRRLDIAAVAVLDQGRSRPDLPPGVQLLSRPAELADLGVNIVVEAAARGSVSEWGEAALRSGADFMVSSASAFCDEQLLARLVSLAEEMDRQIIVPPGALGGMDALAASSILPLESVEHAIIKPLEAWRGTAAEDLVDLSALKDATTFFTGSAREAADRFPQNANAAVVLALAGIGLDATRVSLVADPAACRNSHHMKARGTFGQLEVRLENVALRDNPKSSELTALNLARLIRNRVCPLAR